MLKVSYALYIMYYISSHVSLYQYLLGMVRSAGSVSGPIQDKMTGSDNGFSDIGFSDPYAQTLIYPQLHFA